MRTFRICSAIVATVLLAAAIGAWWTNRESTSQPRLYNVTLSPENMQAWPGSASPHDPLELRADTAEFGFLVDYNRLANNFPFPEDQLLPLEKFLSGIDKFGGVDVTQACRIGVEPYVVWVEGHSEDGLIGYFWVLKADGPELGDLAIVCWYVAFIA